VLFLDNSEQEQLHSEAKVPTFAEQRTLVINTYGEKLVGVLQKSDSDDVVILCHGFRSSREAKTIKGVADRLLAEGISVFMFDFSGNGESEGSFQYGNYQKEVEDLRAVVLYLSGRKHQIRAIAGHSKGGNVVLLYASIYHDIPKVVNISGRLDVRRGIEERLGKDFLQRIKADGYIDVKDKMGVVVYRVTEESLMDRLATDMHAACLKIDKNCQIFTIHGSSDEIVSFEDAQEFNRLIANHRLHIVEGADHGFTFHNVELASVVLDFLK
jgi:alpha/beta superfamily hydrolase